MARTLVLLVVAMLAGAAAAESADDFVPAIPMSPGPPNAQEPPVPREPPAPARRVRPEPSRQEPAAPSAPAPRASQAEPAPRAPEPAVPTAPTEPPAEATSTSVLDYVPETVDLAVHVRMRSLVTSIVWSKLASPEAGLYKKLLDLLPVSVDLEKEVSAAAVVAEGVYADDRLESFNLGLVLELNHDADVMSLVKARGSFKPVERRPAPTYEAGGTFLALPSPRIVVVSDAKEFVAKMLSVPAARKQGGANRPTSGPAQALAGPGDIVLAARASQGLRDAILAQYETLQKDLLRPDLTLEQMMQFSLYYNLVRIAVETQQVSASLDLSREGDALRLDIEMASEGMAPFLTAVLQALADPIQMAAPAMAGGQALREPPGEPFYRAVRAGRTVRVIMSRLGLMHLVSRVTAAAAERARAGNGAATSAEHLRALGLAIQKYVAGRGAWPQVWSDLVRAGLVTDPTLLENPALQVHLPAGDYELVPLTRPAAERQPWLKVLAYEVYPKGAEPARLNVLFADGHVQNLEYAAFRQLYQQTLESLGR